MRLKKLTCFFLSQIILVSAAAEGGEIRVLGLFRDKALVEINGRQHMLVAGKISPDGALLISASSKEAVIEFDGVRESYTLDNRISGTYRGPTGIRTVTITPDEQGMYWVNGTINDVQTRFVVDTGASLISMNRHEADRIGIDYKDVGIKMVSNTAAGQDLVYVVRLNKVRIGDIELRDINAAIHDHEYPSVTLLGNSFLNRVDMEREGRVLKFMKK